MSLHTKIEWCDSSVNPVMGCDGCELWMPPDGGRRACYAGTLHARYAGRSKGYADTFLTPKLFPGRMAAAARWSDLRGTERPDKPWLNGLPRVVFISDMGDALSQDVPFEFLRDEVIATVATWPHIGMWLTKQPQRMAAFARWLGEQGLAWPSNLWAGTSVTSALQMARIERLRQVPAVRFLSLEPLLGPLGVLNLTGIHLVIAGGESGTGATPCDLAWIESIIQQCRAAGIPPFVKQLGADPRGLCDWPHHDEYPPMLLDADGVLTFVSGKPGTLQHAVGDAFWPCRLKLRDKKGGDPSEWPERVRVREYLRLLNEAGFDVTAKSWTPKS